MHDVGHIVNGAAQMKVGGLPHHDLDSLRGHVVEGEAGFGQRALGFGVDGNAGLAAGGGAAAAALEFDQSANARLPVADHTGRTAHGGGGQLEVDDDQAQILALDLFFDQDIAADPPRADQGALDLAHGLEAHGHALALLAACGLDH
jgi:hypothetical protein